jgi:hypothetical protein
MGEGMRFKIGVALGFAAGYWVGSIPPDERRAKLESVLAGVRDNPTVQHIGETVAADARRLGEAVEQRFVETADGATDAVATTVSPGDRGQGASSAAS